MPPQATAALRRHLVRPRRIASTLPRPALVTERAVRAVAAVTAAGSAVGVAGSFGSFRGVPAVASASASHRPIFSLAAAALGLNKAPSTSSSSASPSSSSQTTTTATQMPDGSSYNTITTVRTLPYAAPDLFRIIADVDAYADFLPHCTTSRVTHWRDAPSSSSPAPPSSSWPARADLTVGWGPLSQTYSSRVYCVPGNGVVEAVSGRGGVPTLTAAERAELGLPKEGMQEQGGGRAGHSSAGGDDDPFESLVTRWEVVPAGPASAAAVAALPSSDPSTALTRVELRIRFQFRNPLFQLAAAQVGSEMATTMIEAFEKRAATLLGPPAQTTR